MYAILRVNMGDRPAAVISTETINKTAALFEQDHPQVAALLRNSIYGDDILDSVVNISPAEQLAVDTEVGKSWIHHQIMAI